MHGELIFHFFRVFPVRTRARMADNERLSEEVDSACFNYISVK